MEIALMSTLVAVGGLLALVGWLRPRPPQGGWTLDLDDEAVRVTDAAGQGAAVRWDALHTVAVMTTDDGPWAEDVFFVLESEDDVCVVPQGLAHAQGLVDRVLDLPGVDLGAFLAAMGSTDHAVFLCWRRDDAQAMPPVEAP